ncbi:hypothetical protein V8G54_000284 [Vigna mungo]|uniref:Uncharacterized protein n=1 Tax=Vigna mungo TaxID=3915 RepID=A0AAQ3P5A4_VIGMU
MRVSQVTREGKYAQSSVPRQLVYGTMVYVRQTIVRDASSALARAVCIATRYSAVRRQFGSKKGTLETQVLDYKTQQARLFPLLASAYAFRFVGEWLKWLYMDVMKRLQANDFSTLPEAHACTAGLKSLTTSVTADGIEECRKLCGGHGYLCSSGLPELFAVYIPTCTYEGDNIVLLLQVARHLIKTISNLGSGKKPVGTTSYIGRVEQLMLYHSDVQKVPNPDYPGPEVLLPSAFPCCSARLLVKPLAGDIPCPFSYHLGHFTVVSDLTSHDFAEDWLKPNAVLGAFEARAAKKLVACAQNLSKFTNPEEGFQELSADLVETAVAHCQLIVVSKFIEKLQQDITGKGVKHQIQLLCSIYALSLLHKHLGDFLSTGCITPKQGSLANDLLRSLYSQVRPNAIGLVDAFNYTDHYLGSVLGRYDGDVYPKLYEEAWKDPLNDSVVPDGFQEYIRPMLKQQLRNARL